MRTLVAGLLLAVLTGGVSNVVATELYAEQTGKDCATCHLDPSGGGELTAAGSAYLDFLAAGPAAPGPTTAQIVFRFLVGFVHLATGFLWFGTILYVHLVLKPAYAAHGLPRGEVRVGVVSMIVMGVTGAILTWMRVPDLAFFVETRFGLLLLAKIGFFLVMVLSAFYVVVFIGPKLRRSRRDPAASENRESDVFTLENLQAAHGQDGVPARIAYRGKVFDVTDSRLWKNGSHLGRHAAGADLTSMLDQAPHGPEVFERVAEVGRLKDEAGAPTPLHQKVFFGMAYMNLAIVFIITFIVALWRWG